ncbi:CBASS cGAMP-activated phospholipase [Aquabacterium humicola]|uniref:CBASS cGAMP-activated phospholipase n=1 Tax=Aquabacterium humicola TaxID=3237377 RepID=UPI002543F98F|nr:CBASS cGAMP-activated phospholipase [Rubrivivax pictus]
MNAEVRGTPSPRVLALSGGGFLGLYTAVVLKELEARAGMPLARRFDLLAGTSIGAVLALGLAFEVPAARLVQLFTDHGERVFSRRPLPRGQLGRLVDMSRAVLGPKYSGEALRSLLEAELGDRRLADAPHPVVMPAVDIERCRTKVFKTPHAPGARGDGALRAVDVAMAACAAPTYFPAVRIGDRLYADGGLFAVAPDQIALHEAEHFLGLRFDRLKLLSIGTATRGFVPDARVDEDAGAVGWLRDGRLILTLISVQQQHVQAMVEDRLGPRLLRIDADWPIGAGLGLDVATAAAAGTLENLALASLQALPAAALDGYLKA